MARWFGGVALALALLGAACASDEAAPGTEAGGEQGASGGKEDCVGCDPDGPSAFEQLGLGDRFWQVGDTWDVAYLLRTDQRIQRQPMEFGQESRPGAGMTVLRFEVVERFEREVGETLRPAARIAISQVPAEGDLAQFVSAVEIDADADLARIDLTIDDLFQPIGVTEYDARYPNGRYFASDEGAVARSVGNGFPYVVPNVRTGAELGALPILPPELHVIAEAQRPGYDDADYAYFDMDGIGTFSSEAVYWAPGDLWPFYVETPFAAGVLVNQSR